MTKSPWLCLVSLTSRVGRQCRGDRDRPLQGGRRRLSSALGRGDTAVPGVQRTPCPSRVSHVRNMGTSSRSTPSLFGVVGRPQGGLYFLGENRMPKKPTPVAERRQEAGTA